MASSYILSAGCTDPSVPRSPHILKRIRQSCGPVFIALLACLFSVVLAPSAAAQGNPITIENAKPGVPRTEWDVSGSGDPTIQGFATQISVNKGETVFFKVTTPASAYQVDIYRMGYYQGNGARRVATVLPSAALPQVQPAPLTDAATGLVDCGNWAVSASWNVPSDAVSGIYIAVLTRADTGGASQMFFIVRDDASTSDLLFQTSDTTWQAYNRWGGNSLYFGEPAGRAYKVSYNRPFTTRGDITWDSLFTAEYPMVRWLEANGYNVTYTTGVDTEARGSLLLNHRVFLSVGHDEYWSAQQRANVEAARNAGVHLAFFSGNEVFWKTRWETSIDSSGTPNRTLVCYKETQNSAKIDPSPAWTGTWRDPRFTPPSDGGRPENALTGTIFAVNGISLDSLQVPAVYGGHRFWRNTSVASLATGEIATFPVATLGFEWDQAPDNGFAPAGQMRLSLTTVPGRPVLQDFGSFYLAGPATHSLSLYRHSSGALVFGAGTCLWAWSLDSNHDNASFGGGVDARLQQATVNLLADMGAQPASLQPGMVAATASTDATRPVSTITLPAAGAHLSSGVPLTLTGTAADDVNLWCVEVSTDGGATWHPATGRTSWTYDWTPVIPGPATILSRAVDDSGNIEVPGPGLAVTIDDTQVTLWSAGDVPSRLDIGADNPVELGLRFRSDAAGTITGLRFYKSKSNTGTHVANLWNSAGTLLASASFTRETGSGWQQASFDSPVAVTPNTIYIASYHANGGHYSASNDYFASASFDHPPLHALVNTPSVPNGVFAYGVNSAAPGQSFRSTNYWVDVAFIPAPAATLASLSVTPTNPTVNVGATRQFTATGTYSDATTQDITAQVTWASETTAVATVNSSGLASALTSGTSTISATKSGVSGSTLLTVQAAPLGITTASLPGGTVGVPYSASLAGTGGTLPYNWTVSSGSLPPGITLNASTGALGGTPTAAGSSSPVLRLSDSSAPQPQQVDRAYTLNIAGAPNLTTLWPNSTVPGVVDAGADNSVELGLKFRADVSGKVNGVRFYKSAANSGVHVGSLWTDTGSLLASVSFAGESASGWQQALFSSPVAIAANTVYVVSYHTKVGHYAASLDQFASAGVDSPPLHALPNGESGPNGLYRYNANSVFPNQSFRSSNYWVDVIFDGGPAATLNSISVAPATATITTGATRSFTATGTYSDATTRDLTSQVTWSSSSTSTATINASGIATGVGAGTATITAAQGSLSGTAALTVNAAPASRSLWSAGTTPTVVDGGADNPVQLGVKFRSDVAGTITAVRFYKSAANTGAHVATVWSSTGTLLATATFTNESASGWQQVSLATPVTVTANTIYIVSYHAVAGHYSVNLDYFATTGVDAPPLHAPANGVSGSQGLYAYGSSTAFPNQSFRSSNYWVDLVFVPAP